MMQKISPSFLLTSSLVLVSADIFLNFGKESQPSFRQQALNCRHTSKNNNLPEQTSVPAGMLCHKPQRSTAELRSRDRGPEELFKARNPLDSRFRRDLARQVQLYKPFPVENITHLPYNLAGKLFSDAADGTFTGCPAQLFDDNTIITAAHCVIFGAGSNPYEPPYKWSTNFFFCPEYAYPSVNCTRTKVKDLPYMCVPERWNSTPSGAHLNPIVFDKFIYDYAFVRIGNLSQLQNVTSDDTFTSNFEEFDYEANTESLEVIGYPQVPQCDNQRDTDRMCKVRRPYTMQTANAPAPHMLKVTEINTKEGMSGGAWWMWCVAGTKTRPLLASVVSLVPKEINETDSSDNNMYGPALDANARKLWEHVASYKLPEKDAE